MEILKGIKHSAKQLPPHIIINKAGILFLADIRKKYNALYLYILKHKFKRQYATYLYRKELGKRINWKHPMDLNEKINWLAFYTDTSEWTRLQTNISSEILLKLSMQKDDSKNDWNGVTFLNLFRFDNQRLS